MINLDNRLTAYILPHVTKIETESTLRNFLKEVLGLHVRILADTETTVANQIHIIPRQIREMARDFVEALIRALFQGNFETSRTEWFAFASINPLR